ncbi:hypothetical protein QYF36_026241 [Acer negundo]|nr:hypothetical protein QYF36_026241 [Acer negundo]
MKSMQTTKSATHFAQSRVFATHNPYPALEESMKKSDTTKKSDQDFNKVKVEEDDEAGKRYYGDDVEDEEEARRDPKLWDEPNSFKPERFETGEGETRKLMPFGLGRRSCPGSGLAQRVMGLALGSLIQCFEWQRVGDEKVDMTEGKGITMPKADPLEVLCKARPITNNVRIFV